MMRITVTTQNVLESLHEWESFRPYNFLLLPILADGGYPANVDPEHFTLVAPFESDQKKWTLLECINISNPDDGRTYKLTTSFTSPEYGERAVVNRFENLLYRCRSRGSSRLLNIAVCRALSCRVEPKPL